MLKKNALIPILTFFLISSIFSHNTSNAQEPLSLNSAIEDALNKNPEILAAKRAYEAAGARVWQAASLNDPMLGFEYDKIYADRSLSGEPMKMYEISQDIPFPTKLYLRAKIAAKLAKMAYENYKTKERDVIKDVKSFYAELCLIYKYIEVNKESKAILEQASKTATTRYSVGRGTQADALKAQVELARIEMELVVLEQKRVTAQARLNILMNRDPKEEIGIPAAEGTVKPAPGLEELYLMAKKNNPELKAYRYAVEKGKTAYDLSLNEFMPDFSIKFKQMVERDRLDEKHWAGMVGMTVPVWFFEKQVFGVKEMKNELEMLKADYKTKENMVLFDIRDSYARVEASGKLVELYETAFLPQAEETMNAAISGYESEKADFLTLLDSERMLLEFRMDHYKAILELRVSLADLERAVGLELEGRQEKGTYAKK